VPSFERCVVLAVDDEPLILGIATYALERHGYIVIAAHDGPSALDICRKREGPIHLALLGVTMPGMTGPELFTCLRQLRPNIAALFMSGYSAEHLAEIAPDLSSVDFIEKPFRPSDLVQCVNIILDNTEVCTLLDDEPAAHR
jgi:two-component system cell cycle sensor histidine kinase/response regulator CckA